MINEINIPALRTAMRGYRRGQLVQLANEIGASDQALHLFAIGEAMLTPTVLYRLAELLASTHAPQALRKA